MNGARTGPHWKSFAEGVGGLGAKIPGYSFSLLKNTVGGITGILLPGWSLRKIGWVAGAGFVLGFLVGRKFGGVHVHLTTPAPPSAYSAAQNTGS